jgi:predicted DNA-binding transcriptional regulator AlpA
MSNVEAAPGEAARIPDSVSPLIYKPELLELIGASYPTIWAWMRADRFPRGLLIGGRLAWYRAEVADWLTKQPRQVLKGDPKPDAKPPKKLRPK